MALPDAAARREAVATDKAGGEVTFPGVGLDLEPFDAAGVCGVAPGPSASLGDGAGIISSLNTHSTLRTMASASITCHADKQPNSAAIPALPVFSYADTAEKSHIYAT